MHGQNYIKLEFTVEVNRIRVMLFNHKVSELQLHTYFTSLFCVKYETPKLG